MAFAPWFVYKVIGPLVVSLWSLYLILVISLAHTTYFIPRQRQFRMVDDDEGEEVGVDLYFNTLAATMAGNENNPGVIQPPTL